MNLVSLLVGVVDGIGTGLGTGLKRGGGGYAVEPAGETGETGGGYAEDEFVAAACPGVE